MHRGLLGHYQGEVDGRTMDGGRGRSPAIDMYAEARARQVTRASLLAQDFVEAGKKQRLVVSEAEVDWTALPYLARSGWLLRFRSSKSAHTVAFPCTNGTIVQHL